MHLKRTYWENKQLSPFILHLSLEINTLIYDSSRQFQNKIWKNFFHKNIKWKVESYQKKFGSEAKKHICPRHTISSTLDIDGSDNTIPLGLSEGKRVIEKGFYHFHHRKAVYLFSDFQNPISLSGVKMWCLQANIPSVTHCAVLKVTPATDVYSSTTVISVINRAISLHFEFFIPSYDLTFYQGLSRFFLSWLS